MQRRMGDEEDPEFQVAPMADVLFVLLIFFMSITSTEVLKNVKGLELPDAKSAQERKKKVSQVVVNISWMAVGRVGVIEVDQKTFGKPDDLLPILLRRLQADPMTRVLIRADKEVEYNYVSQVMSACQKAGIANVTFAVTAGGAEKGGA
jgi:biopolymer transport protein ExbD